MSQDLERQPGVLRRKYNPVHHVAALIVAILIFGTGYGIGKGEIPFRRTEKIEITETNSQLPQDLDYESVEDVYDSLKSNFDGDLTTDQLLDGLKDGLARASGDPYTEYLNQKEYEDFNADLNGSFSGIGAELGKENDAVIIVAPIAGFPAERAGLRPRDIIVEIDGENALDLSVSEAVTKIRGPVGSKVKLKVVRGNAEQLDFEITREQITIPSVESEILPGNIGYLKITRFSDDTTDLAREAANKFKQGNVKGVILDLRSNPGGLLDSSVQISNMWLSKGATVLEEKREGKVVKTFKAKDKPILNGIKTIVLIDEGSASASEITAGALKDNGAATLIGMKSFGKGSVQSLEKLSDGGVLKVTIARWFTPAGKNIDKEGIEPDQEVEITDDDFNNKRDPQKQAAIDALNK